MAEVLLFKSDSERALALYRQVLAIWPQDRFARAAVAAVLREAGRFEELGTARTEEARAGDAAAAIAAAREAAHVLHYRLHRPQQAARLLKEHVSEDAPAELVREWGQVLAQLVWSRTDDATAAQDLCSMVSTITAPQAGRSAQPAT